MTKREHQWLPSLHHGYQTDSDLVKLNTNHPAGDEKKEEGSLFFILFQHLKTFSPLLNEHPPHCEGRGQWCLSTSLGLQSLIVSLQIRHVCRVGGDGPADKRRFDLFSSRHVAAQQGLDVSSVLQQSILCAGLGRTRSLVYFLKQNNLLYRWRKVVSVMSLFLRYFLLLFHLLELLSSLSGVDILTVARWSCRGRRQYFYFNAASATIQYRKHKNAHLVRLRKDMVDKV